MIKVKFSRFNKFQKRAYIKLNNLNNSNLYILEEKKIYISIIDMFKIFILAKKFKRDPNYKLFFPKFKNWFNLNLYLKKGVFVPQFDTEKIVSLVLENEKFKVGLEIGYGSGAISLAISKNSKIFMDGIDINKKAYKLAKINKAINNIENVDFRVENLFIYNSNRKYDFIVCNPPYILRGDNKVDEWVSKFQPPNSIYVNNDLLEYYDFIISNKQLFFEGSGKIFFEISESVHSKLNLFLKNKNLKKLKYHKDLSNKIRFVEIVI